jgi:hypothetical protein
MDRKPESRPPPPRIDAEAKAAFLAALRDGATREDAAAATGFSLTGFYGQRRRDPGFAADWAEALAQPPAAERRAMAYAARDARGEPGEMRIAPANRRRLQRRRRRHVRFTAECQAICLAHLAVSGDTKAAAEAAGVCKATVHNRRRADPAFAELYRQALAASVPLLEAEALCLALKAHKRLRAVLATIAVTRERPACCPTCGHSPDEAEAFDRAMRLLARHDRKERRMERTFRPGGRRQPLTFEQAIADVERYLRGIGVPILGEGCGAPGSGDPTQRSHPGEGRDPCTR